MAQNLKDPNLSAGAIVEKHAFGLVQRNDGVKLQPANTNPWYVLATIEGEQGTGEGYGSDLAAKNRRYWNGWACAELDDGERGALAKQMDLAVEDLKPLDADENAEILKRFKEAFGAGTEIPKPSEIVQFSNTYFKNTVIFKKYVISNHINFDSAHFECTATFSSAHFENTATFSSALFYGSAVFSSARFLSTARFDEVEFNKSVPQFHATQLYEDTAFQTADGMEMYWPPVSGGGVMPAIDQKRAYNRLRLL